MLNADTVLHTSPEMRLTTVPVFTAMHFTVTYHDDVGEKFFATNTALKYRPSRWVTASGVVEVAIWFDLVRWEMFQIHQIKIHLQALIISCWASCISVSSDYVCFVGSTWCT